MVHHKYRETFKAFSLTKVDILNDNNDVLIYTRLLKHFSGALGKRCTVIVHLVMVKDASPLSDKQVRLKRQRSIFNAHETRKPHIVRSVKIRKTNKKVFKYCSVGVGKRPK